MPKAQINISCSVDKTKMQCNCEWDSNNNALQKSICAIAANVFCYNTAKRRALTSNKFSWLPSCSSHNFECGENEIALLCCFFRLQNIAENKAGKNCTTKTTLFLTCRFAASCAATKRMDLQRIKMYLRSFAYDFYVF